MKAVKALTSSSRPKGTAGQLRRRSELWRVVICCVQQPDPVVDVA